MELFEERELAEFMTAAMMVCTLLYDWTVTNAYPIFLTLSIVVNIWFGLHTWIVSFHRSRSSFGAWWREFILRRYSTRAQGNLRADFRQIWMDPVARLNQGNHPHPSSAFDRTAVNVLLDSFISQSGYKPYSVSMSERDMHRGNDGSRHYHFAKDLAMEYRDDVVTDRHVLKFMDVDYYCDMSEYAEHFRPMLLYTFVPQRVCGSVLDAVYRIEDDRVYFTPNGGGRYDHLLWDYDTDSVMFDYGSYSLLYKVESVATGDPTRRIVGLFPECRIDTVLARTLPGYRLRRRLFSYNCSSLTWVDNLPIARIVKVNMCRFLSMVGSIPRVMVSLAEVGAYDDICIPDDILRSVMVRCSSKKDPVIADIERILREEKSNATRLEHPHADLIRPETMAPALHRIFGVLQHAMGMDLLTSCANISKEPVPLHYQTLAPLVHEDGVPMIRQVAPAMCLGNIAPVRSYNNDTSCVEGRVLKPRNPVLSWPKIYDRYAQEFSERLIPDSQMHTGVPWSTGQVMERQNRPTQVNSWLMDRVTSFMHPFRVKAFQKSETYTGTKYPRNISTTNADHRTRYGSFIYPFCDAVLKATSWYAFGKTPKEIADRLHEVVRGANVVIPTDFSSWDGTHSLPLCLFERALGRRYFAPRHHAEWDTLVMSQYNAPGSTRFGVKYSTVWSRLSGSSDTSAFNSVDNAFLAYCVRRESGEDGECAWNRLGLYGGDDGITCDVSPKTYNRIATRLGHSLKAETLKEGDPVPFLGRYYLDAWTSNRSCADIQRAVRKLHLTTAPINIPGEVCLVRKAEGLLTTDPNTPVLSQWAKTIIRLFTSVSTTKYRALLEQHSIYWSRYTEESDLFPTYGQEDQLMIGFAVKQLGVGATDLYNVMNAFAGVEELEQMPKLVFPDLVPKIEVSAAFGGQIIDPPPAPIAKEQLKQVVKANGSNSADPNRGVSANSGPSTGQFRQPERRPTNNSPGPQGTQPATRPDPRHWGSGRVHGFNNQSSPSLAHRPQSLPRARSQRSPSPRAPNLHRLPAGPRASGGGAGGVPTQPNGRR